MNSLRSRSDRNLPFLAAPDHFGLTLSPILDHRYAYGHERSNTQNGSSFVSAVIYKAIIPFNREDK